LPLYVYPPRLSAYRRLKPLFCFVNLSTFFFPREPPIFPFYKETSPLPRVVLLALFFTAPPCRTEFPGPPLRSTFFLFPPPTLPGICFVVDLPRFSPFPPGKALLGICLSTSLRTFLPLHVLRELNPLAFPPRACSGLGKGRYTSPSFNEPSVCIVLFTTISPFGRFFPGRLDVGRGRTMVSPHVLRMSFRG